MSDDEKPKGARIIDWQLKRPEYREALRSRFLTPPDNKILDQLLKRLEEAERNQAKK
ncbi:hypothetical protein [Phyllobacterium chamaecytisi]|uniref:hypothetical protein n=1 Tax=Phyllobacterium chamaecytisi TaxID=2876082 RepID=UPI001CCC295F|nr:hypothetical protein [Phyllobacterium sp. KW56]MBZ9605110.1 hypothetical protein [Phyllobacterium sp. KW56]